MVARQEKGYTLMELLLVIGLMGLLSTIMILNGSEARNQAQLQTAAQTLESALTQAQSYGNSGRAYTPPLGAYDSDKDYDRGYGVYFEEGTNKIIIYGGKGDLDSDGIIQPGEEIYIPGNESETITFSGGVTISKIKLTDSAADMEKVQVLFRRGESEAHIHGKNAGFYDKEGAIITLKTGSVSIDVYVYKTGLIYIDQ